jgi:predicted nucleic acid-binding protein
VKSADTSVIVAAFATWHERHDAARKVLDAGVRLIEHAALETYSVLTRLPPPHRGSPAVVRDFIETRFADRFAQMKGTAYRRFLRELPERGIAGGAAYDALIAATDAAHSLTLVSVDLRAARIYEQYGVEVELL